MHIFNRGHGANREKKFAMPHFNSFFPILLTA
ncbi:hypothetical protein JOD21_001777 [Jeotgalibacillus terrae]|nr:hypothetical protein [Jeotgalibacillus terrae]